MRSTETKFYVYGHFDRHGQLRYIGKGHGNRAWNSDSRNGVWETVFKAYFPEVRLLAESLSEAESLDLERNKILAERKINTRLINICDGGIGGYSGERHPLFGTKRSKDTIEKMLATKTQNDSFAKPWLGKSRPVELMKKMSAASQNPESKEKRYAHRRGVPHTQEHKDKIKASSQKTAVICSNGQRFESINDAARKLNLACGRVSEVLNGKRKTANGLSFRLEG